MIENDALERELRISAAREAEFPLPDLGEAAATAGLLDVAYAKLDSPLGTLLLAVTDRGLVRLAYVDFEGEDEVIAELSSRISPRVLAVPRKLDAARRELDEYFTGSRHEFELPVDWRLTQGFGRRVLRATARIPYGGVSSYKQVAAAAGSPGARARPATRSDPTRSRSSSPATGCCTPVAGSAATPAALTASGCCSRSSRASEVSRASVSDLTHRASVRLCNQWHKPAIRGSRREQA